MCILRWEELEKQPFAIGRGEQHETTIWTHETLLGLFSDGIAQVSAKIVLY